ncbi:hypothetical protein QTQ03_04535 [Micromonospora sp. WMMA1363]|uniref:hypothetical protein n=1 Tax=Micromonospora sp. WMMA1363 TaxID=3053985 RepID=UPI00259CCCF2|nr:hypothetical protein [Micromonospora sp. WMMA1363]MDM4718900.1 hypothetical protein [Micromonospora sp. WMMA1363]
MVRHAALPPERGRPGKPRAGVVYASWNGSTQTAAWQVLAGPDPGSLSVVVGHAPRTGFETTVATGRRGPYFQVRALDRDRNVLGTSVVTKLAD